MTTRKADTYAQEMREHLRRMQEDLTERWVDASLPDDWNYLDGEAPVERHRSKVTLRLDTEMLRWFKKLGPGYQKRINDVLMIYWRALLSGHVKQHWDKDLELDRMMLATSHMRERRLEVSQETLKRYKEGGGKEE